MNTDWEILNWKKLSIPFDWERDILSSQEEFYNGFEAVNEAANQFIQSVENYAIREKIKNKNYDWMKEGF